MENEKETEYAYRADQGIDASPWSILCHFRHLFLVVITRVHHGALQ